MVEKVLENREPISKEKGWLTWSTQGILII